MSSLEYYTHDKDVLIAIDELLTLKKERPGDFIFSDIVDKKGNQYVDLVQEGGGVLGIALLGYTYVLEKVGIRFLKLAGTSAGAINTVLLAAAGKPEECRSELVLEKLYDKSFFDFVDGGNDVKGLINCILDKKATWKQLLNVLRIRKKFSRNIGLNPGDAFMTWMEEVLKDFNVITTQDLLDKLNDIPAEVQQRLDELSVERDNDKLETSYPLAIVAADLSTETKAIFPELGHLYFNDPMGTSPAVFVRASMSVPGFFCPLVINEIPNSPKHILNWKKTVGYYGPHPEAITFVDGGIMSNFPINIFHMKDREPSRPTFGVKLGLDRKDLNEISGIFSMMNTCFNSARQMSDYDFIMQNPDYREVVANIETGDHNWLNFKIEDEAKLDLFRRGALKAARFLKDFDWPHYKGVRRGNLMTVVGNILGTTPEFFDDSLDRAAEIQKLPIKEKDKESLMHRLKFTRLNKNGYKALWIDDNQDEDVVELSLLNNINVEVQVVISSEAARRALGNAETSYDLIISDVNREGNSKGGIEFLKELHDDPSMEVPPTIFYLEKLNRSYGVPPYAFGITNSPVELLHLVLDILQRN